MVANAAGGVCYNAGRRHQEEPIVALNDLTRTPVPDISGSRLLIVGCSKRKRPLRLGEKVPAGKLYDGVVFRTVRAWKRRNPAHALPVLILSAEYGLIGWDTAIQSYERRMTEAIAKVLLPQVRDKLVSRPLAEVTELYIELGKDYLRALPEVGRLCPRARVVYGHGRIGLRLHDLRDWLEDASPSSSARK